MKFTWHRLNLVHGKQYNIISFSFVYLSEIVLRDYLKCFWRCPQSLHAHSTFYSEIFLFTFNMTFSFWMICSNGRHKEFFLLINWVLGFIQQTLIKGPLYVRHYSKWWGYISKQKRKKSCLHGAYILGGDYSITNNIILLISAVNKKNRARKGLEVLW